MCNMPIQLVYAADSDISEKFASPPKQSESSSDTSARRWKMCVILVWNLNTYCFEPIRLALLKYIRSWWKFCSLLIAVPYSRSLSLSLLCRCVSMSRIHNTHTHDWDLTGWLGLDSFASVSVGFLNWYAQPLPFGRLYHCHCVCFFRLNRHAIFNYRRLLNSVSVCSWI